MVNYRVKVVSFRTRPFPGWQRLKDPKLASSILILNLMSIDIPIDLVTVFQKCPVLSQCATGDNKTKLSQIVDDGSAKDRLPYFSAIAHALRESLPPTYCC